MTGCAMGIILDGSTLRLSGNLGLADRPFLVFALKGLLAHDTARSLVVDAGQLVAIDPQLIQTLCAAWILLRLAGDRVTISSSNLLIRQQLQSFALFGAMEEGVVPCHGRCGYHPEGFDGLASSQACTVDLA